MPDYATIKRITVAGAILAGMGGLAHAVPLTLTQVFDDPAVTTADFFGGAVAIDGNTVLIGAASDDTNGQNVGLAHLFDATTGLLLQTFNDPTPTTVNLFGFADSFGAAVSISGDNVLIGAPGDDTIDINTGQAQLISTVIIEAPIIDLPGGTNAGQAHLFSAATGALLQTFNDPTPAKNSNFGSSVAVDGDNVLIAAPGDDGAAGGQALLFDAVTGALLQTFNDPTIAAFNLFGRSVAIDGNNVLIGAFADDTDGLNVGQAYLFDAVTGALLQTFNDPTVTDRDRFGESVAIDGNNVLIGAVGDDTNGTNVGQAYLFDAITGALLQIFDDPTVTTSDLFGVSVSIDGANVLIGALTDDSDGKDVGQAYLFDAATGALLQIFNDPTVTVADFFGYSVAVDGGTVLIGAPFDDTDGLNVGQVYMFSVAGDENGAQVPEPSSWALLGMGLLGLVALRRRRGV